MKTGDRCVFTKSGSEVELMGVSICQKVWIVKRIDNGKETIASEEALVPIIKVKAKVETVKRLKAGELCLFGSREVRLLYVGTPDHGEPTWAACLVESGDVILVHEVSLRPISPGTKVTLEGPQSAIQKLIEGWERKDPKLLEMLKEFGVTDIRLHQ